ncbi:ABC transporter substrate-binding protein [Tomitella gaofuii]|uniref:ABC transporter substrate-binding protein n=1 Tax=Tomitella gaofuii TaxID=2760083 RepID=UPI0015FCA3F1|nr:ABC transporter substrate-binding protein [Tomitella gaofuii]
MRRSTLVIALCAVAALLAACSVGRGSAIKIDDGQPVRIGVIPVADFAPVYIAVDKGYFADAGIDVELQVMQNAAAIAPSVLNGQLQFGTAAASPFLTATQKGLPLEAVANQANVGHSAQDDASGLLVAEGSDIARPADLQGRTVAVNALNSIVHVAAAESVRRDGGDPNAVTWVAMPFPDMMTALAAHRVDAASVVEPFVTIGAGQGLRSIANPYVDAFTPGGTYSLLFTAEPFVETNPELVRRFADAIDRASVDAQNDPEEVRRVLVEYGKVDPAVAEEMTLPGYGPRLDVDALDDMSTVMVELGFMPEPVDAAQAVVS